MNYLHLKKFVLLCPLSLLFSSCEDLTPKEAKVEEITKIEPEITVENYLFEKNKDSVIMTLNIANSEITGTLDILNYEKDSRRGTITNGVMKGDTLFALYNSMQEGQSTECEIALLKKGETYTMSNEFMGDENYQFNEEYTKGTFKDKSKIKFNGNTLLKK